MPKKIYIKPECRKCGSTYHYALKDGSFQCRNCGYLNNKDDEEDLYEEELDDE